MKPGLLPITMLCLCLMQWRCKNDQRTELFEMQHIVDFELHAGLNTLETHFYRVNNLQSQFEARLSALNRDPNDIVSVTPKFAQLSTVFQDEDLDFIRQVFVRVFDPFDPDHVNTEVFYLDPVPPNTNTRIRPFPGLANVLNIVSMPTFGLEVGISLWEVTPKNFDMRLEIELSANID